MATVGVKGSTLLTTCYLPSLAPASSRWAWYSECSAAYISSARRPACWPESAPNSSHQQPALSDISKSVPKPLVWSFRHYKSPTAPLDMHHLTFGINSLLHSVIPLCSLSSWFTSSYAYHLITVITFVFTICHSLYLSLQTWNSSLSQILSSLGKDLSFWTAFTVLNLYCIKAALALFVLVFFLATCAR